MEFNHPMSIFAMPQQQQQLPHCQPIPQPCVTPRVPLGPGFHSSQLYRDSDYYNSYEGPRQYPLTRMSPMSLPMSFHPDYKPYSYTPTAQNLMQVHYDPGRRSPSDGSMYQYPTPSSSSQYSYITSQTGTETFTQDGTLPSVFQSNQPAPLSPASCSYAENHLGSSPVYLQNQSNPSYNKDHRISLQQVVGVPQDVYGKMAAEDLFFIKASQYGIQVMEKQTGCKDMKVEPVNDSVKEEKAILFKTKASQNGIMIQSPQEAKKTLDLLLIAKEKKAMDNNSNCSFLLDVHAETNATAKERVQWYNNYGENVSLSNKIEVSGECMAKKSGSIYSASWSAEKFTSILDTDNRHSKFTEQCRMSPTKFWMMDGRHDDVSRDGSLEGIEQTVLDALNLQEVAWETEDDDALSWELEMAQEEKVEDEEEGQNVGVELEDEERIKEEAKCLVETIIARALKELRDEEHFSKEEETKVDDYWSEAKVDDYWSETRVDIYCRETKVDDYLSEIVTEGKEISNTEEQSVAKEIIEDSVVHTLDDPGSVGDDPGLMSANGSSEIDKDDLKKNMVFQKQPQNKEFDSALMNEGVILKSTHADIEGQTAICASKVDRQFETSCSSPPLCFELNPESPEFKPAWKKIGDNWNKAYTIKVDALEELRASLNAVTEEETVPEQYVDSDIQPEIDSESFLEECQVIDDRMINFEAPGLGMQVETCLNVGQECEKSSASHKIALKLNTDCPEFKPESRKFSAIRPDAPEFTPSLKTFFLPSHQDVACNIKPKAKVLHLVMPKVVEKFKSVDTQASVQVKEASSLTRKVKTKDTGIYTGSCDCRDVCVNTLESMACEKSKFYIPKEIMFHSTKSVSCGTEPQSTGSIGINADVGSYKETELIEKLKQAQMELIQCRADLHVLQLEQTISNLKKEKKTLMEVFIGGEDKVLIDQIIDKRILKSRKEILNIEVSAKSWMEQIQMGQILDSVPALLFQSETQGSRPAVGDFHQSVHLSPFKFNVSPVRGGFGAINIDSYKMDMTNDRVMASSKGPSLVDTIRTPIKRKMHEYTDLREAGPVFGKSLKPYSSPVDSVQAMHSIGPNGQFSPEIMVSPRHRHKECSAQSTSPRMITSQQMGAEPRVQDSHTTNTLPMKDWWYLHENIEDTRKAEKVQRLQSLVQKAEHMDQFKKESEGLGKNDVKMQESDVEVKSDTQPPWYNMMLDIESSEDAEVKSDTQPPRHNMMLDIKSSEDAEVKSDTQPPRHNMMLDIESSEDAEVKSDTQPPRHNMMLDIESSEDAEVKSDTQPPWHNMMLDIESSEDAEVKSDTQPPWHNMMQDRESREDIEVKSGTQLPWHNIILDRENSEDAEVKSDTQPPWHNMILVRESNEDVEVKSDTQPPRHNMMLDREGSEDAEVKSDTQPPRYNLLDRESSEDVEVKSDTQPPGYNMMQDRESSEDAEVKSGTQPPQHNMMQDRESSEDAEVKSDTQPPRYNMLDRESSEDAEVKSDTQPSWHNMMQDRESSEDVEVKSDTQPPQHNMMQDRESSEDAEVKSDTQPPRYNMLDRESSEDVEVKSDTQASWHNMMQDRESSEDVEVWSGTQLSQHDMVLNREDSEDDVEGTKKDSQDRDQQVRESEPDLETIVNFNSSLPILNENCVMITHRMSEGEISGSEKEKTTSSDFRDNAVMSTLLGLDETLMLAEFVRKTGAVTDFQENKLSVCSSGFESRKVGSFDHDLEKDQVTSSIKNWESKVIMDREKDYIKEINTNNNNNDDINVVNSDTLCSALKFDVTDFSIMSKTKDVSSDNFQCEPISTKTLVHDRIVNSPEDSHLYIKTGEIVIVNNDVTTKDLLPSNGHCSIAVDATNPEIISSSVSLYEKPLDGSLGITDPAIISVSKMCSQSSHAGVDEPAAMDGISSQKSCSPSMEQHTVVVSTAYSESFKTKSESGLNQEVGNTLEKTTPSPVNFETVLNLANAGVPNFDSGAGLSISEGFTPVPGPVSPQAVLNAAMPSLSSSFMPVFSMPQVQTDRLGMPSAPQRSTTTSPPTSGMVLAAQKGIPDPAGGIMGVDPILYKTVLAQIMKAYPDLSKNSEMLRSLALQQTTLLQFYISGGGGHFNLAGPVPQSSVPSQLGTTGPSRLWTEFEEKGMNVLLDSNSKESTDIPKKPLAPPPGNLPIVLSSESSCSNSVSKGFDFTLAVESTLKPIGGASSSVTTSALSFSFANTAGSFTATAKIDTKTKSETTHSNLHHNLSITSKTDQVHSKPAQEDNAKENINSAAKIETSTQARISSSSDWGSLCHKNELDVLHKNNKLLTHKDVQSPELSGSHLGSMQTKPSGSVQNLHGAFSNREPPGQASNENRTLMPQPDLASYPMMPPWATQPSMLQPRFGSYPMMPHMAAQPQLILPQYVKPNMLSNLLSPRMAQPRVFHPRVMQPCFTQHQPQKLHFMKPQHSFSAGWQHRFPQSILGLPQNVRQQNVSTPSDNQNDSTKGTSNHTVTREASVPHRTPDSYKHNVTSDTSVPHKTPDSDNHTVTRDTSVPHRTPDSYKHNVTSDTSVPHKTPDSNKHNVTSDTSVPHKTPDSDKLSVTRDTSVAHKTCDSDKHIVTRNTAVPHRTPDSDKQSITRDLALLHKTPDSDQHIFTRNSAVPHRIPDSKQHSITRDMPVPQRTPGSNVAKTSEFTKTVKSTSPADKFISNFVGNEISKSAEKLNVSGLCPITTHSTAFSSRVGSDTPAIEPKLSSPFGSEEACQPDFLPSFVKTDQYTSMRKPTPPVSKTAAIPELMKTQSWRGPTWETRENWDDEVDEYPEQFILKHNVKRDITGFSGSYSAVVKPRDSKPPVVAAKVRRKNEETNSTNPWASQVQGHQGIGASNERKEGKKQEESWTEVTKKKKKESLKQEPFGYTMTKLGTVSKTKASNFEKLIQKLMECFSSMNRSELIDVITQVRKSRGGSLSGMTMKDIVDKAGEVIMAKQHQRHKSFEQSEQKQQQRMFHLPNSVPANSGSRVQRSQSPYSSPEDIENDEDICVICHDGLSTEETKKLDCGHVFHFQCIKQWVLGRERTCPNCRSLALFPEEFPHLGK